MLPVPNSRYAAQGAEEDITSNPKNFDIKTVESSLIAGTLNDDNSLGVVNATFAIAANLATSATLLGTEQLSDKLTNANILAVRDADKNEQWVKDLVDSLTSATCYDFITEHYNGIIDPSFERPAQ